MMSMTAAMFDGGIAWLAVGLVPGFLAARVYRGGVYGAYGDTAMVIAGAAAGILGGCLARAAPEPDPGLWPSLIAAAAAASLAVWAIRCCGSPAVRQRPIPRQQLLVAVG